VPIPKLLKSGEISEATIQKTVIHWVRLQPKIKKLVIHIPNEGKRSVRYGRLLKDMGMVPGASDLFIAMPSHGFNGAWIELKSKNGVLTPEQADFLNDMSAQNYFTAVCRSIDETIKIIKWYCFC
jgi:hypothetical protein